MSKKSKVTEKEECGAGFWVLWGVGESGLEGLNQSYVI